jgi:hypothetical protein
MNTDTPRTDKAEYTVRLGVHKRKVVRPELCRELERELAAAREEIEMLGIRYAAAEMHHANNMQEVTEQRDGLKQAVDCASDLLASVTEQRDEEREIYGKSYSAELARSNHYKQQRDRLAEAMRQMRSSGDIVICSQSATNLTTNEL